MPLTALHTNTTPSRCSEGIKEATNGKLGEALPADIDEWPPFLLRFSADITQATDAFVDLFLSRTIQFRCGQLASEKFVDVFLARWLTIALHRRRMLEQFLSEHGDRLTDAAFNALLGSLRKMECATRDAEEELRRHRHRGTDKAVSFARPLAYRIARRSNNRLSVRSLSDGDGNSLSSPFNETNAPPRLPATVERKDDDHRLNGSPSPAPQPQPPRLAALDVEEICEEEEEQHFTGRASGVFYGSVFNSPQTTGETDAVAAAACPPPGTRLTPQNQLDELVSLWVQQRARGATRRLAWCLVVYWILPMVFLVLTAAAIRQKSGD